MDPPKRGLAEVKVVAQRTAAPPPVAVPERRDGGPSSLVGSRNRVRGLRQAFFFHLLAGSLVVSVPLLLVLGIGLTYLSGQQITQSAADQAGVNASSAAIALTDWVGERQRELSQVARNVQDQVDNPGFATSVQGLGPVYPHFKVLEIVNRNGMHRKRH